MFSGIGTSSEYFESTGITIIQPLHGHRYGEESIALADFCRVKGSDLVAELGSGCGIISLMIAARDRPKKILAIEIQQSIHEIAVKNVEANNLGKIVSPINGDYRELAAKYEAKFDVVLSNPPFFRIQAGRLSSNAERAQARHELNGTVEDLLVAAKRLLAPNGRFLLVFSENRREGLMKFANLNGFATRCQSSRGTFFLSEFEKLG